MSRDSIVNGDWPPVTEDVSVICRVFLSTHDGLRRKFEKVSCMECTGQGNDPELIPTLKMEN